MLGAFACKNFSEREMRNIRAGRLFIYKLKHKVIKTGPDNKPVELWVQGLKVQPGLDRNSTGCN